MKNKKLLTNLLFAVVILAIAAVLLVVRRVHASGSGLRAELIYGDNNTTMNLPLDVDETYDVDTGYYTVHIQIKDGAARFVDSPCPDHICEGFGWLSNEDQTATSAARKALRILRPLRWTARRSFPRLLRNRRRPRRPSVLLPRSPRTSITMHRYRRRRIRPWTEPWPYLPNGGIFC